MLKELGLSLVALSSINGVRANTNRSHVVYEDDMAITYKYETNEVSTIDDLIIGNIYHFDIQNFSNRDVDFISGEIINFNYFYSETWDNALVYDVSLENVQIVENTLLDMTFDDYLYLSLLVPSAQSFLNSYIEIDTTQNYRVSFDIVLLDFVINEVEIFSAFSECENIPIESVERVYPSNIFGFVSEFIDENILAGIPNLDNVAYTIGGQEITMRSWLNTTICVVLACLLIGVLLWFIRYLFRLFGGLLH